MGYRPLTPQQWTDTLVDPWVPASLSGDLLQKQRARVVVMLAIVQAIAPFSWVPLMATLTEPKASDYGPVFFSAGAQSALPWVLRRTGRVRLVTHLSIAFGLVAAWTTQGIVGGLAGPMLLWTLQSTVFACLALGVGAAWRWAGVNALVTAGLCAVQQCGWGGAPRISESGVTAWAVANAILATVAYGVLESMNERARADVEEERERAMDDLRNANLDLARARDDARSAEQTKGEFLASMSHEIRTPMNAVIGMTGLLIDTPLDEVQRSYAETVRTSADALLTIVNDILDFSKIEAGRMELEVTEFDLQHCLTDGLRLFAEQARGRNLNLVGRIEIGVPVRVHGDPGRLRQIVLNLVGNAIKFTERGSISVTVSSYRNDLLRFDVRDTGVGIAGDALKQLFQPFSQADRSTTRRFGGTGLGLAICRQLVELMEGRIKVRSTPGKGSTFTFSALLPAAKDAPRVEHPIDLRAHLPLTPLYMAARPISRITQSARAVVRSAAVPARARVLVVEDNVVNQRVARALLAALGYDSDVAANGSEAVDAVARIAYAVVLMDVQMPVMDGLEAVQIIRSREGDGPHVPVIALTANVMSGDKERCAEAGMSAFLAKPIQRSALAAILDAWCPRASIQPAAEELPAAPDARSN